MYRSADGVTPWRILRLTANMFRTDTFVVALLGYATETNDRDLGGTSRDVGLCVRQSP